MERPDRTSIDEAQKAKLIFISLAAIITILLIFSYVSGNTARHARDEALKQVESLKQDNAKLSQWLEERTREADRYKKAYESCKAQARHKAKPAARKSAAKRSRTSSRKKRTTRHRAK